MLFVPLYCGLDGTSVGRSVSLYSKVFDWESVSDEKVNCRPTKDANEQRQKNLKSTLLVTFGSFLNEFSLIVIEDHTNAVAVDYMAL